MAADYNIEIALPSASEVALVVVTYNPDRSFLSRFKIASRQFHLSVIVDNSETSQPELLQLQSNKIRVVANGSNLGLSAALNTGCDIAIEQGYQWIVTLDQDTELSGNYLKNMLLAASLLPAQTAVFGCNYFDKVRSRHKFSPTEKPCVKTVTTTITSGCMTYLPCWLQLGKFRSDYFIDSIDHEYCLRVRKANLHVAINRQPLMVHSIGELLEQDNNFAKLTPLRHDAWRTYTCTRNTTRTVLDFAIQEPIWGVKKLVGLLYELLAAILLGSKKRLRLQAYLIGMWHGLVGDFGPVPDRFKKSSISPKALD